MNLKYGKFPQDSKNNNTLKRLMNMTTLKLKKNDIMGKVKN